MSLEVSANLTRAGFTLEVDLKVDAPVTALFGPSGAGKTTLARIIAGLEQEAEGKVTLKGREIGHHPAHLRNVGYVFQDARLFPHLSVRQNLLFGAGPGTDPRAMADTLGIAQLLDRRPAGLSGGEAARVALGRALLRAPDLLILDEPLAGLDQRRKSELLPYFAGLRDQGVPILYISHAIEEVAQLADSLVLMRDGGVERAGPLTDLLGDPASAALVGPSAAGAVLTGRIAQVQHGLAQVETGIGAIWVPSPGAPEGSRLRLRIPASDVIVSVQEPQGVSALNVIAARVDAVHEGSGPGVMLRLAAGDQTFLARVTRRSMAELGIAPGTPVWAMIKATGVSRGDVGL